VQLLDKPECDREEWCKDQGAPSALNKIITTGFRAIHLIYFFTAGADEVKCWQIRKATKAPQVCGV
jgi:obg-like ATPase 1